MKKPNYTTHTVLLLVLPLLFLSAMPYLFGPGLTNAEPIGKYLNGNFPATTSVKGGSGNLYDPVFPNITFDSPLTFSEVSNNRLIVGQRDGKIYWFNKDNNETQKNLSLDLSDRVGVVWDAGFLGLQLHPKFGTAGYNHFYTFYSTKDKNGNDYPNRSLSFGCDSEEYYGNYLILAKYDLDPNTLIANKASEEILFKVRMFGTTHRGGGMVFGDDGFLYVTTGDQTAARKSQDIVNNIDGGVLRLDVDKNPAKSHAPTRTIPEDHGEPDEITGRGYYIPNDNPFLSPDGNNFEEFYSMGHRNPHRLTKDRQTGTLYVGEVGGSRHEEINVIKKGKNYGWPTYEGLYKSTSCVPVLYNNMAHEAPLTYFPRGEANALIGGYVYRGNEVPELTGKYICADYGTGEEIWAVDITDGTYEQLGNFASTNIISFGEDKDGEIYILKQGQSSLYKFTQTVEVINELPEKLSETGAFTNLQTMTPANGVIPFDLIEPFWSDGAEKKRWMAIPNDGTHNTDAEQIDFSENGDWEFPIGSVLIKHFDLPLNANNPNLTKRLETRFSIKGSDGKFYFATYKWNDAQTDATLLDSGLDEPILVTNENGQQETQVWHYPSGAECLSCHNDVSGGTLGPRTRYLNKNITYDKTGINANQLVTLSHLGILNESISDADVLNYQTYKASTDVNASLDEKARSYLDLNCAYCHRSDSDNRATFDLRLFNSLAETGLFTAEPNEPLGIPGEEIIVAKDHAKSILYHRINSVEPGIAMPILAKNKIDEQGTQLIKDWINQLDEPEVTTYPNGLSNIPEGNYYLISKTSGKTIEVPFFSLDDGANVQQVTQTNSANEVLQVIKSGDNGYYTMSFSHSGKLLDVLNNGTAPSTNVQQLSANGGDGQKWGFYKRDDGYYNIVGKGSQLYLDLNNASKAEGENIKVYTPNGNNAQLWKLVPAGTVNPAACSAEGSILLEQYNGITGNSITELTSSPNYPNNPSVTKSLTKFEIETNTGNNYGIRVSGTLCAPETGTYYFWIAGDDYVDLYLSTNDKEENKQRIAYHTDWTESRVWNKHATQKSVAISLIAGQSYYIEALMKEGLVGDNLAVGWRKPSAGNGAEPTEVIPGTHLSPRAVTTAPIAVTSVAIAPNNATIDVDDNVTLSATVSPANATNKAVTWKTSNAAIATVDENGKVTGKTAGTATITATTTDGDFKATATITVNNPAFTCSAEGSILLEQYNGITGDSITELTSSPNYPNNPSVTKSLTKFEIETNTGNNYGIRVSGTLCAPETGTYYFWIAGDDYVDLYLSTNDKEENKQRIAFHTDWTESRVWNKHATQKSAAINLIAGESYYIEAIMKEGLGGDNLAVGWRKPSTGNGAEPTEVIPGAHLSPRASTGPIAVTGVTIISNYAAINVDENVTFTATVSPQDANDKSIVWSSSDTTIATVDANGKVTGKTKGTATITATTTDGDFKATATITVSNPATCSAEGSILLEQYNGITGNSITELISNPNYPNNPSATKSLTTFEIESNTGNNYGIRVSGTLCAPETGKYYFWIAGDDYVDLNLSTNDKEENKQRIAFHTDWSLPREWNKHTTQKSVAINLIAGESYYIEAIMKEGLGGDNLAVGWRKPSQNNGAEPKEIIPGKYLSPRPSTAIAVSGVTITPNNAAIDVDENVTFVATVSPQNANDKSVVWTSNDVTIATVDANGTVKGIAKGTAAITATTTDGGFKATAKVTVNQTEVTTYPNGLANIPEGNYYLISRRSNKTIEVAFSSLEDGANVQQVTKTNAANETLQIVKADNNGYYTMSFGHSGKLLDVLNNGSTPSTNVQQLSANGSDSQLWGFYQRADGYYYVVGKGSELYLDLNNANTAEGENIKVYTPNRSTAQQWLLVPAQSVTPVACSAEGSILLEQYNGITGNTIAELTNNPNFPNNPSVTKNLTTFEIEEDTGSNYGVRVSGTLCAPETGTYYFWISGDDYVDLYLSTDNKETNKQRIAYHTSYTLPRVWNSFTSQKSAAVHLIAGQSYYIAAIMKEGLGHDHLAVGWRIPSSGNGTNPTEVIPGNHLSPTNNTSSAKLSANVSTENSDLIVTPNPADTYIQLAMVNVAEQDIVYAIYAPNGTLVMTKTGGINETINISNLSSGVYTLVATIEGEVWTKKVIIK